MARYEPKEGLAFTSAEWHEFVEGMEGDTNEAWDLACHMWNKERRQRLEALKYRINRLADHGVATYAADDLFEAVVALHTTSSSVYHEVVDQLCRWLLEKEEQQGLVDYIPRGI